MANIDDPALKDRIEGLKAIRDQAKADAERAQAMLDNTSSKAITPQMIRSFAKTARQRIRLEGGGYRRDHLRALAQRAEVAEGEVRIIGSKSRLLQTLIGNNGVNSVRTQGLKWRTERDSNPRTAFTVTHFPGVRLQPLGHLSTLGKGEIHRHGRVGQGPASWPESQAIQAVCMACRRSR